MARTKKELVDSLKDTVRRDLEIATAAAKATKEGATHEENKPENDKDTRAIEMSYLAGAQGERVRELEATLAVLEALPIRAFGEDDPIGAGALVRAKTGKDSVYCFFCPKGGGIAATFAGEAVQVVTPKSPLGQALLGARVGEEVEVELGRIVKTYEIESIE